MRTRQADLFARFTVRSDARLQAGRAPAIVARVKTLAAPTFVLCALGASLLACSAGGGDKGSGGSLTVDGGASDGGSDTPFELPDTGTFNPDALVTDAAPPKVTVDPKTCAEAEATKAYVGCDFWPTVVANNVWSVFDYAVVVANASDEEVSVDVTGNGVTKNVKIAAQSLSKIYLPWVPALKGPDTDSCGTAKPLPGSVFAEKGAYHLVASRPVTVYQFNALEYKGAGGEAGKDWSSCPGNTTCATSGGKVGCFSFSNDASLLLPSTAMTGNYRVTGINGWSATSLTGTVIDVLGAYVTITATQDGTNVTFKARGKVLAGGSKIAATAAGGELKLTMNAGDVAELVGEAKTASDLSGSLVTADKPVQVIAGVPCMQTPIGTQACDHLEESVFPAETLGKDYIVAQPSTPNGKAVGHLVRFYGNRDGTKLTYLPSKPPGAPDTLNAGQVVAVTSVTSNFRVTGDQEFAIGTFMYGGERVDPQGPFSAKASKGDPSMSFVTSIEQFRTKYIFLAPDDYPVSYVDIVFPDGAIVTLDGGKPASGAPIGSTGYYLSRSLLGPGKAGAHTIVSDKPIGIQVMGYGDYTSYHYPGGLDLKAIAPPPPIK